MGRRSQYPVEEGAFAMLNDEGGLSKKGEGTITLFSSMYLRSAPLNPYQNIVGQNVPTFYTDVQATRHFF
jgi:hypothetical protein